MERGEAEKGQKGKTWSEMRDEGRAQALVGSRELQAHALGRAAMWLVWLGKEEGSH